MVDYRYIFRTCGVFLLCLLLIPGRPVQATQTDGTEPGEWNQVGEFPPVVVEEEGNQFRLSSSYSYTVVPRPADYPLPEGYEEISLVLYDVTLTAYVPIGVETDFYVLYCRNPEGSEGYYVYDSQEHTIQRYRESALEEQNTQEDAFSLEEYKDNLNLMAVVTAAACALAVLCFAGVIRLLLRLRKENDDFFY